MKNKKLIVQVNKLLVERSKEALNRAKKEITNEKRASKTINDAFKYYAKTWNDVVHPGLVSIGCEAVGGDADDVIAIQVATLLLTAGFDVHDDIIDESETKYGKPTVYAKFGKNVALLVGDAFLMKALILLHKLEKQLSSEKMDAIWNIIDGLFFELGDAEALEASLKSNVDVSAEECFKILKMKSSTFEAHMRIGAIVGGAKQGDVELLGDFGRTLGLLINIREDFIDVFEAEELQNRFKNECLPIPILYAFKNKQTKKTIMNYFSKQKITDNDAEKIVDIVFDDKNVELLRNEITYISKRACNTISHISNSELTAQLKILISGIIEDL
ncbi:MAG: polyprenyl synthetase family protein [Candidatus Bathyarchaeota archaeon]|nr:polyprenyl synthetase family protein [Candidatus Bathyarchaeum sp.]